MPVSTSRWADLQTSENRQGHETAFKHPFFQAAGMFVGETMCECPYPFLYVTVTFFSVKYISTAN